MRIGILGGTFDPAHLGHLALARSAVRELRLDRFFFVPARRSPFKEETAASSRERLRMLKMLLKDSPKTCRISRLELDGPSPSYTVRTVRHFRRRFPRAQIYLLMGSDAYSGFRQWRDWRKILKLCELAVARRAGEKRVGKRGSALLLRARIPRVSSSRIRAELKKGKRRPFGLSPAVANYIHTQGLYR